MQAIGIFGGTFDPIHYGHLRLAEEMAAALDLREVRFIPSGQPPHRVAPQTAASHRLEMVRRAITGNPRFVLDEREVRRARQQDARPSYTVDTLNELRAEVGPAQPLYLLLGADAFLGLPGWHEWRRLFELAHIVVAERAGTSWQQAMGDDLQHEVQARRVSDVANCGPVGTVQIMEMTPLAISARAIREALATQKSVRYLLPDGVLDYLQQQHLYKS